MTHKHQLVSELLEAAGTLISVSDSPRLDCQIILASILGCTREWVIGHSEDQVCLDQIIEFRNMMTRRQNGEPIAYLLGYKDFWDLRFKVTKDTLVPRPETELLIETILDSFDEAPIVVADFGAGSGAIAVTLASERPEWQVIGIDINNKALEVAKINGKGFSNLSWVQGNWGNALAAESLDLLICNPPYIAANDPHLNNLCSEPQSALVSGDHGLADLKTVIQASVRLLKVNGHLMLEHGHEQQQQVCARLHASQFVTNSLRDLNGNPRAVLAKKPGATTSQAAHDNDGLIATF
jgi:release factor glutamine methyltransferase